MASNVTRESAQAVLKAVAKEHGGEYSDLNGAKGVCGGRITFARQELVVLWPPEGPWVESVIIPGWGEKDSDVKPTLRQAKAHSDAIFAIFLNQ